MQSSQPPTCLWVFISGEMQLQARSGLNCERGDNRKAAAPSRGTVRSRKLSKLFISLHDPAAADGPFKELLGPLPGNATINVFNCPPLAYHAASNGTVAYRPSGVRSVHPYPLLHLLQVALCLLYVF